MGRTEKTVFISYRRTNFSWALAIFQDLSQHGFDVFFDYTGIRSGDFESVIIDNIKSRAHFVVLLTPSALERCGDPGDWLRREIETALEEKRNIIPLMLENFDFGAPGIGSQLTGDLEALKSYNGLRVPPEYFFEAMGRLRDKYLTVPLDAVLHPASRSAKRAAADQQAAAATAPPVQERDLTAEEWFERGFNAVDPDEEIRCFSEAIRLKPDLAEALNNRGIVRTDKGDLKGAIEDLDEAIRLKGDLPNPYYNRARVRYREENFEGVIRDCNESLRLEPNYPDALVLRGLARKHEGDTEGALEDYTDAIRLKPDHAGAFNNRGVARKDNEDMEGALGDYTEAIRLQPGFADAFKNRARLRKTRGDRQGAAADYQKYLDLGGGVRAGDQAKVEQMIRDLKNPPAE